MLVVITLPPDHSFTINLGFHPPTNALPFSTWIKKIPLLVLKKWIGKRVGSSCILDHQQFKITRNTYGLYGCRLVGEAYAKQQHLWLTGANVPSDDGDIDPQEMDRKNLLSPYIRSYCFIDPQSNATINDENNKESTTETPIPDSRTATVMAETKQSSQSLFFASAGSLSTVHIPSQFRLLNFSHYKTLLAELLARLTSIFYKLEFQSARFQTLFPRIETAGRTNNFVPISFTVALYLQVSSSVYAATVERLTIDEC
ncbi:hypothetical protein L1887_34353 [Cichorium endivia]|nr:hypothetical protein L1887_34353 [Cichorium endivia]